VAKEVHVSIQESEHKKRGRARNRVSRSLQEGKLPGMHDVARARGLIIRERQHSIFSDAWIPLAIIILIAGIIAGRNAAVIAVGVGMIVIAAVSSTWRRFALSGVTYVREYDQTHAFPGEPITVTLTITNAKPLPLTWLRFTDTAPIAPIQAGHLAVVASEITGNYQLQTTLSVNSYEKTRRNLSFRFPVRGFYNIGPVSYLSGDIFTLFTIEREYRYIDTLVIYPQIWTLETLELPAKEMFGEIKVRRSLFTDPVKTQGIRDYQPQDRFRDVHWKATARKGDLQTKVYEPTSGMNVVTFLNVATFPKHWMGFDPDLLERAISVVASICNYAAEQKWGIGMYANGSIPGSDQPIRVAPGHSPDQIVKILEALAAVTEFATGSIDILMHKESTQLPQAATFVLVTAVVTEEMLVALLRLRKAGRRITLISMAEEVPPRDLPGILAYHLPKSTPAFAQEQETESPTEKALNQIPTPSTILNSGR
jgi:uncharacterized protein (DUF58 family)